MTRVPPERVFLLWPTTSYRADAFLEAARRLGVEVAIGSDRCHELAALFSSGDAPYYQAVPLDFRDPEHASRQIQEAVREKPVRAIVSTDDHTTAIAARAAVALGLATNPVRAVEAARNKRL